jgi:hypothetical protein
MKLLRLLVPGLSAVLLVWSYGYGTQQSGAKRVSSILNREGTVRVGGEAAGSFNPRGYRLVSGPGEAPRFEAASSRQTRVSIGEKKGSNASGGR